MGAATSYVCTGSCVDGVGRGSVRWAVRGGSHQGAGLLLMVGQGRSDLAQGMKRAPEAWANKTRRVRRGMEAGAW